MLGHGVDGPCRRDAAISFTSMERQNTMTRWFTAECVDDASNFDVEVSRRAGSIYMWKSGTGEFLCPPQAKSQDQVKHEVELTYSCTVVGIR